MKDLISLIIYGLILVLCISLFINLLPLLIIVLIVFLVMRYFRENKSIENEKQQENPYQTNGNIKSDVIDVEYKETVEK